MTTITRPTFMLTTVNTRPFICVETLEILEGSLPKRARAMVLEWAAEHRTELLENWRRAQSHHPLRPVAPLE